MFFKKWKEEIKAKLIKEVVEDVRVQVSKSMTDIINIITHQDGKLLTDEHNVRWDITNIKNAFKSAVERLVTKHMYEYDQRMYKHIDTYIVNIIKDEEFIDSIVERILKKQLTK